MKENREDAPCVLYIFAAQLMTSSLETAGIVVAFPPMLLNSMDTLSAVFSSGASDIHTASYGPSVMKPWWNLTPHDSAVFMCSCIFIASSLVGACRFFTRVTNHIVAAFCRTLYIRRHQDFFQIEEFGEVEVGCALCRLRVLPRRVP